MKLSKKTNRTELKGGGKNGKAQTEPERTRNSSDQNQQLLTGVTDDVN